MHHVRFYPVGNGDCSRSFWRTKNAFSSTTATGVKPKTRTIHRLIFIRPSLTNWRRRGRDGFDVLALTHLDDDHIANSTDFFFLEHAKKYQSDERKRIGVLWVPAAAILETGLKGEAAVWRSEARHRLKEGKGIRVFSKPSSLEKWLESGRSVAEGAQSPHNRCRTTGSRIQLGK